MRIEKKHMMIVILLIIFFISSTNIVFASNSDNMKIQACLISTHSLNEKTCAIIYVGENHANEKVKIQIFYTCNGKKLNPGNKVKVKVNKKGCIEVLSAKNLKKFPDHAIINLYNLKGNRLIDSKSVKLDTNNGTQIFYATKTNSPSTNKINSYSSNKNNYNSGTHRTYIGNKNTGKFHNPGCSGVSRMKSSNKVFFSSRQEAVNRGYSSCALCNP